MQNQRLHRNVKIEKWNKLHITRCVPDIKVDRKVGSVFEQAVMSNKSAKQKLQKTVQITQLLKLYLVTFKNCTVHYTKTFIHLLKTFVLFCLVFCQTSHFVGKKL